MKHIKLTALVASVALACSSLAGTFSVYAEEVSVATSTTIATSTTDIEVTSGSAGENVTWSYDEETETLTFSGTGALDITYAFGPDYFLSEAPIWVNLEYPISHIIIEEGITSLGYDGLYYFGYRNLKRPHTIEFPESLVYGSDSIKFSTQTLTTNFKTNLKSDENITCYAKTESYFYYVFEEEFKTDSRIVSTGTAETPFYATSGTLSNGITYHYDLDTRYLYLDGSATWDCLDYFFMYTTKKPLQFYRRSQTTAIIIGKDVIISDETIPISISEEVNAFMYTSLRPGLYSGKPIYYYAGSSYDEALESYLAQVGQTKEDYPFFHCIEATNTGDVNMDGQINLADVALLQKYTLGLIDAFDTQKLSMDCDGDGDISANDTFVLLQFVMQIIDAFPTSMD